MQPDWRPIEVSCECGLTIEFYHWLDPSYFRLAHDPSDPDSILIGVHVLTHQDSYFTTYLSYIEGMVVQKGGVNV